MPDYQQKELIKKLNLSIDMSEDDIETMIAATVKKMMGEALINESKQSLVDLLYLNSIRDSFWLLKGIFLYKYCKKRAYRAC